MLSMRSNVVTNLCRGQRVGKTYSRLFHDSLKEIFHPALSGDNLSKFQALKHARKGVFAQYPEELSIEEKELLRENDDTLNGNFPRIRGLADIEEDNLRQKLWKGRQSSQVALPYKEHTLDSLYADKEQLTQWILDEVKDIGKKQLIVAPGCNSSDAAIKIHTVLNHRRIRTEMLGLDISLSVLANAVALDQLQRDFYASRYPDNSLPPVTFRNRNMFLHPIKRDMFAGHERIINLPFRLPILLDASRLENWFKEQMEFLQPSDLMAMTFLQTNEESTKRLAEQGFEPEEVFCNGISIVEYVDAQKRAGNMWSVDMENTAQLVEKAGLVVLRQGSINALTDRMKEVPMVSILTTKQ